MSPSVQSAIPDELIVATIVPEIYTFGRQNHPGAVTCPIDVTVYEPSGTLFYTDAATNQKSALPSDVGGCGRRKRCGWFSRRKEESV